MVIFVKHIKLEANKSQNVLKTKIHKVLVALRKDIAVVEQEPFHEELLELDGVYRKLTQVAGM